jgi:PIN domain nuclease of toxin-antitoxin system
MIVADSQSIYWYLAQPDRLSPTALAELDVAEGGDGIVVSSWTVPELWMATTRKRGPRAVPRAAYELARGVLLDPHNTIRVEPFDHRMWPHFEIASLELPDPFDSAIVATARSLDARLVTSDAAIARAGLVDTVW